MNMNTAWVLTILGACLVSGAPYTTDSTIPNLTNIFSEFSDKLVKTIADGSKNNFVMSPLSLAENLLIAYFGASGETKGEIQKVLNMSGSGDEFLHANLNFVQELNNNSEQVKLFNSLYIAGTFNLVPYKEEEIIFGLHSTLEQVNFADGGKVADDINEYVRNNTNGTIKNVVEPKMFSSDTRMVAVNVLYFTSEWEGFQDLGSKRFHIRNGTYVETPMIHATELYEYYTNEDLQIVSIPFKNDDFQMTLVMSRNNESSVLPSLSEALDSIRGKKNHVRVILPQFSIESQYDFVPIMQTMGVKRMFSKSLADFSEFSGEDGLYVSSLIQKAYIKVNSGGVEASAATVMGMDDKMSKGSITLSFDGPFNAYITYKSMPLFAMRVNDPQDLSTIK